MFNLIPVVMFLLMQGVGADGLTLRQQQALLDLAHRANAVQSQGEIEAALANEAGIQGPSLAFWIQLFSAIERKDALLVASVAEAPVGSAPRGGAVPISPGLSEAAQPRDGPF